MLIQEITEDLNVLEELNRLGVSVEDLEEARLDEIFGKGRGKGLKAAALAAALASGAGNVSGAMGDHYFSDLEGSGNQQTSSQQARASFTKPGSGGGSGVKAASEKPPMPGMVRTADGKGWTNAGKTLSNKKINTSTDDSDRTPSGYSASDYVTEVPASKKWQYHAGTPNSGDLSVGYLDTGKNSSIEIHFFGQHKKATISFYGEPAPSSRMMQVVVDGEIAGEGRMEYNDMNEVWEANVGWGTTLKMQKGETAEFHIGNKRVIKTGLSGSGKAIGGAFKQMQADKKGR